MLKIRNDVDLKELEKFGFEEHIARDYFGTKYFGKIIDEEPGQKYYIVIEESDRKITIGHYQYECGAIIIKGIAELLYDLIQANIVEKVEG